jgi:hypothetical protein
LPSQIISFSNFCANSLIAEPRPTIEGIFASSGKLTGEIWNKKLEFELEVKI